MNYEISISLLNNVLLLLALSIIYALIPARKLKVRGLKSILAGCIIGLVGIVIMYFPFPLAPGFVIDVRSILIAVSGLFFGLIPTVIAVVMTSLFRIYQGGGGTFVGVCVIVLSAIIGLLWRYFRFKKLIEGKKKRWLELYLLGIVIHVGMLACFFFLPWATALTMLKTISLPVMIIYPIGTVLLGMILLKQIDNKNIHLKLNESEKSMRRLFSNMFDAFAMCEIIYDSNKKLTGYKIIESNKVFDKTFGDNNSQVIAMCKSCINDKVICHDVYKRVVKTGVPEMFTIFCPVTKKYFEVSVYSTGKDTFATIHKDISDLKNSEKILYENEKKFRLMFEEAPMGYQSLDENGYLIEVNKAWLSLLGYKKQEVMGKWFGDFLTPEYVKAFEINFPKFKYKSVTCTTFEMLKKNNEKVMISFNGRIAYNESGKFKQTHYILQDITAQREAEKKLKESEKKYRTIFDQATIGICSISLEGKIINANKKYCDILGYSVEELKELTFLDMIHPDDIAKSKITWSNITSGKVDSLNLEIRYIRKNGSIVLVVQSAIMLEDSQNKPMYTVTTILDITEKKRLEEEKRQRDAHQVQQQRLESIGTLAGGVAHEINNPINGIMNYSQLILDSSEIAGENAEYAKEIIFESERIATIVKNLLQFSRQENQTHSYANVETIIEQTLSLIKAVMRHDQIDLQLDIPKGLPDIKCRSQQIQQVIMNLLTNARDALNEKYPGYHEEKIIKLYCKEFNKHNRKWIRITVEDYGSGITESVQEKLFEPFFTTKERDKGTGLGLPISYGIVKDHQGELTFETEEGSYTRFYLDLPVDNGWEIGDKE